MEKIPAIFNVDGQDIQATYDNCGIAMFRDAPEVDYLDIWLPPETEGAETRHHWIFGQRERLIWMGRICLQRGDDRILHLAERELGTFRDMVGWNPQVLIEDTPREYEQELFARTVTESLDDEWTHWEKE